MMTRTPKGSTVSFVVRGDTNDGALVAGILGTDEYELADLPAFTGWGLDIGAHVGTVAIAMAIDNPELRMIAVEPVPDNCDIIRRTIAANGLADRVFVEEASLGAPGTSTLPCHYAYTFAGIPDTGYVEQNRYIGNLWRPDVKSEGTVIDSPVVTIDGLAEKYGAPDFSFGKTDCEGCEWDGLSDGAERVAYWIGEWHDRQFDAVETLLGKTHDVTLVTDYGGSGIFRAIRR